MQINLSSCLPLKTSYCCENNDWKRVPQLADWEALWVAGCSTWRTAGGGPFSQWDQLLVFTLFCLRLSTWFWLELAVANQLFRKVSGKNDFNFDNCWGLMYLLSFWYYLMVNCFLVANLKQIWISYRLHLALPVYNKPLVMIIATF